MQNSKPENNMTFEALDFKEASRVLKSRIKKGTMFQQVKLLELDSLQSKNYYF